MDFSRFSNEKISRFRKKLIPWHCQKRYQESLNEFSMNHSFLSAFYRKKIKSLQKNNKFLALALQQHRSVITEKDSLMVENGKSMDIINFSRLKLMDMLEQMKKSTACLEETLQLLNLGISDNLSKHVQNNVNYRTDFKNKLQEINIEPIEEVTEKNPENTISEERKTLNKSNTSKKDCSVKRKGNHEEQISKVFCSKNCDSSLIPTYSKLRNSKKNGYIAQCKKKRMALENNTSRASICYSKPSPEISNVHYNTNYILNKSDKNETCAVLSEIGNTSNKKRIDRIIKFEKPMLSNPIKNHQKNIMNSQKASERDIHSKKKTITKKIDDIDSICLSTSNISCDKFQKSTDEIKTCPTNQDSNPCITLNGQLCPNTVIPTAENKPEVSVQNKDIELVCNKNNTLDVNKGEKNITYAENKCVEAFVEIKNNTQCNKIDSSKCRKRVCFYFDEEVIETMKSKKAPSKVKNNFAKRKRALRTITKKADCNDKINRKDNSFVVKAEVHPIPDDVCKDKSNSKNNILNLQPCVVLTDILKSNKISDTFNKTPPESDCLRKATCIKSPEGGMDVKENNPNVINLNSEKEKKKLPMQSLLEKKDYPRRAKAVSYKEPSLNLKMRRCI